MNMAGNAMSGIANRLPASLRLRCDGMVMAIMVMARVLMIVVVVMVILGLFHTVSVVVTAAAVGRHLASRN